MRYLFLFIFVCGFAAVAVVFSLLFSFLAKIFALAVKIQPLQQPLLN